MTDETKEAEIQETPTEKNYGEALAEMRRNSVPKEQYDKLAKENKELMDAIINGTQVVEPKEESADVDALRKDLFEKEMTNLDYIQHALALREALIAKGEPDPFLPEGSKISPTLDDVAAAERVADTLRYCVDVSNGDPTAFTAALQSKLIDPPELKALYAARKKSK